MKVVVQDMLMTSIVPYLQGLEQFLCTDFEVIPVKSKGASLPGTLDEKQQEQLLSASICVCVPAFVDETSLKLIATSSSLSWFHCFSVGVEPLIPFINDMSDGLIITNASGVFDIPIAEYVVMSILMAAKRMSTFIRLQKQHVWPFPAPSFLESPLLEAQDIVVGLVGVGAIGKEVAKRCKALGMKVVGCRRDVSKSVECVSQLYSDLLEMLPCCDCVVLAVPLTKDTQGMMDGFRAGATQFAKMKSSAWMINVSRGSVVVQSDLMEALKHKTIAGAVLDVVENEPLNSDDPLWDLDNVILTPHISWSTPHVTERQIDLLGDNLARFLDQKEMRNVLDWKSMC